MLRSCVLGLCWYLHVPCFLKTLSILSQEGIYNTKATGKKEGININLGRAMKGKGKQQKSHLSVLLEGWELNPSVNFNLLSSSELWPVLYILFDLCSWWVNFLTAFWAQSWLAESHNHSNETCAVSQSTFSPYGLSVHSYSRHLADPDKLDFTAPKVYSCPLRPSKRAWSQMASLFLSRVCDKEKRGTVYVTWHHEDISSRPKNWS